MSGQLDIFKILIESGLVVKLVLLVLLACSIASWTIIFKKYKFLNNMIVANVDFLTAFRNSSTNSEILSKANEQGAAPLATMFRSGHEEISKIGDKLQENDAKSLKEYFAVHGVTSLERALKKGSLESIAHMETMLSILASIASVSPFIGLFGTVWGIINSFTGLGSGGTSLETVAPGIAEALVATAVGLFAAIPAVWFYNLFTNKISSINSEMEAFGQDYLNFIERSVMNRKS